MNTLSEVIARIQEGQIVKAYFANENWYIIKLDGVVRYCDKDGFPYESVSLTYSALKAIYKFL